MVKKEFALFAAGLRTYYPNSNMLPNTQAVELWYEQLADIPYEVAEATLKKWVAVNKWPPTIADIREQAVQIREGAPAEWGEGWAQVMKAVSKYGFYQKQEALESMAPITRRCVERIGWSDICMSENVAVERANFRMIYEREAEREKREAQIPEKTRQMIERTKQKLIGGDG